MATEKAPRAQVKKEHDAGRWSRVSRRMWLDKRFRGLSGEGRMLWMYLLTTPHAGPIPGLFSARESGIAEDLRWSLKQLRSAFNELAAIGFEIETDWDAGLVWLPNAVKHNPPPNPNVVTGWRTALVDTLPECELLNRALASIRTQLLEILENPGPYVAAFDAVFGDRVSDTLRERVTDTLTERVAENTTHDARRTTQEEVGAASPAPATTSASVPDTLPAPAPCLPGWEPLVRLERYTDGVTAGAWCIPWFGNYPGDYDGPEPPTPEQALWSYFAIRVYGVLGQVPAPPGDKQLRRLRAALEAHGPEALRRAWLCWLTDPWAASRTPPFALNAFLTADQLAQMLERAKAVEWRVDESDVGDWELPEPSQEANHAT